MANLIELLLDPLDTVTDWTALDTDTANLATTTRRVAGTAAMEFDKANTAADSTYAGASRTFSPALDISKRSLRDHICIYAYVSAITNVASASLRIGTDASNYVEYLWEDTELVAGSFAFLHKPLPEFSTVTGTGCDFSAIAYTRIAINFDAETDTLADIAIDQFGVMPSSEFTSLEVSDVSLGSVDINSFPAGNLGQQAMAASLSMVPASNITDATYIGDIKFGEELPAGTQNIGNVDIVTLPAGNLGQRASAASLSVTPATDVADATYIGDIKFGEELPAGTQNIGDVDILSVVPGTGATNLGKADDVAFAGGETGVLLLGVRQDDADTLASADGRRTPATFSEHGCLNADVQHYKHIDHCEATAGWTALSNDTINLATTVNHTEGILALEFDKTDGLANTVFGAIQRTLTSFSIEKCFEEGGGFWMWSMYIPDLTEVDYAFIRYGTDSTNYNEWRIDGDDMSDGWNNIRAPINRPDAVQGNGWNSNAVTYVCVGAAFDAEDDALADMAVDDLHYNTGMQVSADITAQVTTSVDSAVVRVSKVGTAAGGNWPKDAGNANNGTPRVVIATDDINLAALNATLAGPGAPSVDSYASDPVVLAASTPDQVLVASPGANKQIWVHGFWAMADTAAGTLTFQDEDNTPLSGTAAVSDEGGWVLPPSGNFSMPWIIVATNKALEADIGACTIGGIITYSIVSI